MSPDNRNIDDDLPNTPIAERKGTWRYALAVSLRGPFVTCWSASVVPGDSGPDKDYTLRNDSPPRPETLELTMKVARQFDLTYLDAQDLLTWSVEDSECPEDIRSYLEIDEPNAFNILFFEI